MSLPLAHEKWFTEARPGYSWDFLVDPATLAVVGGAIAVAVLWRAVGTRAPKPELPFLSFLSVLTPWLPRLLGIHAGVSLLSQAAQGSYLAPPLDLPTNPVGTGLAILEGITGVWMIAGYKVRPAAALLILAGPAGMLYYGVIPVLERLDLLGIAAFLFLLPPDDTRPGGTIDPEPSRALADALLALRVFTGGALIVLAFTEKLLNPELALHFLEDYPAFNILATMGLNVPDLMFVRIAGAVELLFGLLILMGSLPQIAVIVAGIPFNVTLFFLGKSELIGHLPVYGTMLVLIVCGSDRRVAKLVPLLRRWRTARVV